VILVEAILLGLLLSLLTGGSAAHLKDERLRGETLLLVLLPLQLLWPGIVQRIGLPCELSILVWLLMMGALAFLLFYNAPRRWMLAFAGLGIAMNVLVIGSNGAMPVSLKAASEIGATRAEARIALEDSCLHEALDGDTRLVFLADVIATPGPSWQRGVISIGDILLAAGLGAWVFAGSQGKTGGSARLGR
jgi:hypothetical protein